MSPLTQTFLTLFCMLFAYVWGFRRGGRIGISFICNMLEDEQLKEILVKMEKNKK